MMKILHLDLELAPNLATVWGIFKQNIAINQLLETSRVMCFSAKWHGDKKVIFHSEHRDGHIKMIENLHHLMDEADAIVTYNGNGFDLKVANREFLLYSMNPPAPYKSIDLLATVRKQFRFVSNKLDHVSKELGLGQKTKHEGHELWLKCMEGDDAAWKTMEKYNKQDVLLTEKLYNRLLPWIDGHPHHALYVDDSKPVCRNCGSEHIKKEGFTTTLLGKYQQYSCTDCGRWGRGGKMIQGVDVR